MTTRQLREYVAQLPAPLLAPVMYELEKVQLASANEAITLVLSEMRKALQQAGITAERFGNPSRLFFRPVEPYVVEDTEDAKPAHIARASLDPIWLWLCRDLIPTDAKCYVHQAKRALLLDRREEAEQLANAFQRRVVSILPSALATKESVDEASARLRTSMAPPRALTDLFSLHQLLSEHLAPAKWAA